MKSGHPTYPNPTIREALCEIHFDAPDGEWKPTIFGEFFKGIQDEFPEMEPVSQVSFQLQAGPGGIEHMVLPPRQMMRYKHKTRNLIAQLGPGLLTVNVLPVYPGWKDMQRDILDVWSKALATLGPRRVTRVGLRYIDSIAREQPDETPGDWLAESKYVPTAVLGSLPGLLYRSETRPSPETRLIVSLGEGEGAPPPIVLDIDCIIETPMDSDMETIRDATAQLHNQTSEIFFASVTDRLEKRLKGA